ncbi:heavy metal translocating P-type ATPase [Affinibrenneria salicis]|uniref:P-type Zn(2+) transporter n=1 Tax=Affinibrenneria salicis TaxID=2590031 RepID=A0A5J5FWE3_9GAMM|nr:heavy metal translocating P-type ATPase [Affinibrenneria salicis]KAA8998092.1 heavy metal translocating P-type ATPase [Affinibrenneria salicis]
MACTPVVVLHRLPGRLRVRLSPLRHHPAIADWLRLQVLAFGGVHQVRVRPEAASLVLCYHRHQTDESALLAQLRRIDWAAAVAGEHEQEYCAGDVALSVLALAGNRFLPRKAAALTTLAMIAPTVCEGVATLRQRQLKVEVLDALALSVSLLRGDYGTAMLTHTLLTLGEYMEQKTSRHSDSLLAELMQPQRSSVWVERDGETFGVDAGELACGDLMLLGPGDTVPADGKVVRGAGLINQASLTGESVPVRREKGAFIYAGTLVQEGNLAVCAEQVGDHSTTARIRRFIIESLETRSETQELTQAMADRRVAITFGVGALVFALTRDWQRLASVFMIDYSCALKLSTPVAFKSTMYRAAQAGLLLKGGRAIEQLAVADVVVFDKTGTLTYDDMLVTDVVSFDPQTNRSQRLLALAASVEEHSNHPLSRAVVDAARQHELPHINHGEVEYVIAHGLLSEADGHQLVIGSRHFLSEHYQIDFSAGEAAIRQLEGRGRHLLFISLDGKLAGMIGLQDRIRDEAPQVLARLRAAGVRQLILLSGDQASRARQMADELGMDGYFAEATPESKVQVVQRLQAQGRRVMFVGDGVNDAPVLTQASVGIAMNKSTALAQQAADVVLLRDSLDGVAAARELASQAIELVSSNIKATEWINSGIMFAAALGYLSPAMSALLHNSTTIGVLLRALAIRKTAPQRD